MAVDAHRVLSFGKRKVKRMVGKAAGLPNPPVHAGVDGGRRHVLFDPISFKVGPTFIDPDCRQVDLTINDHAKKKIKKNKKLIQESQSCVHNYLK